MASTTIIKFPDGRTESKNVITSFEKNSTNVIVFETDKIDNGHKVVGISYLSDGMYQNVVDVNKWKEIKGYLVEILHDQMVNENYRVVPDEVLVTEDYIHPLGLRDENLEKIASSYETFKSAREVASSVQESLEAPISEVSSEPIAPTVAETNNVIESTPVMSAPTEEAKGTEIANEPLVQEQKVEEPSLDPFAIADSLETGVQNVEEAKQETVSVDAPVVNETIGDVPIIPIIGQNPEVNPSATVSLGEVVQDSVPSQVEIGSSIPEQPEIIGEDIIPPQVDITQNITEPQVIQSEPVSALQPATNEILESNSTPLEAASNETISAGQINVPSSVEMAVPESSNEMIESLQPAMEEMVPPASAVQNTYENAAGSIVQQARALTENYIKEINELSAKYLQEMEEMRSELSRNLEEAKGINELSKQTFDKAQSMAPIQEGPSLELSKAA